MEASGNLYYNLILRTQQRPDALIAEVNAAVRQIDPDAITFQEQTMEDGYSGRPRRFFIVIPRGWLRDLPSLALLLGTSGCTAWWRIR